MVSPISSLCYFSIKRPCLLFQSLSLLHFLFFSKSSTSLQILPWFFPSTHKICTFCQKFSTSPQPAKMHALRHRHIPFQKCRPDFSMSKAGCNLTKQRLHPRFFLDYLTASASHLQRIFSKSRRILSKIPFISLFHFYLEYFLHYTAKNLKFQQISDFTVPWKFLVPLATDLSEIGKWGLLSQEFQI